MLRKEKRVLETLRRPLRQVKTNTKTVGKNNKIQKNWKEYYLSESLSDTTGSGGTSAASNLGNSTGMTANMKNPTVSITNLKSNILSSTSKNSMNVSGELLSTYAYKLI